MASTLAWLDYSDHERRKALEVIDLFHEDETRDELGIGSVRDAFADLLFPGTSTIQTRVRYFLFIPWIYCSLEKQRLAPSEVALRLRREEVRLMNELAEADDARGVIGKRARDSVKRLPSSVYWSGLGIWGIRKCRGSQEEYHRLLASGRSLLRRRSRQDDGELLDHLGGDNWHTNLPSPPEDFPGYATFDLTGEEAHYLTDQVINNASGTMIAYLLDRGHSTDCDFIWDHPQCGECSAVVREQISHAEQFSLAMHGAALLYNLMLAKKSEWDNKIDEYHGLFQAWREAVVDNASQFSEWDRNRFWEIVADGNARVPDPTRCFVKSWLEYVFWTGDGEDVTKSKSAQALISEREYWLKRARARLHNPRSLENWRGKAGTARMDYRWATARDLINDVLQAKGR